MICPSPTEGRLGRSQALVITDKAARNILVQVFVWTEVFGSFEKSPRTAIAESYGLFNFVRKRPAVFQVAGPCCAPTSNEYFLLLRVSPTLGLSVSGSGRSDGCVVVSPGGFL